MTASSTTTVPVRSITVFLAIAFGLSWLVALPLWLGDGLASPWFLVVAIAMMMTPTIAALVVVFFVDRPHWGTGLSTRLMQQAFSHASQRGCDAIWTLAWQQAPRAFRFLRREGFDVAGSMTSMIGDETREEWVMVRRLD